MKEIWLPIKSYEGLYEISNFGEVKSLQKSWDCGKARRRHEDMLIKKSLQKNGYEIVCLHKNSKKKNFYVHRLVALSFCNGFFEHAYVNHIDGNKTNNIYLNLEWVTPKGNSTHAWNTGLIKVTENMRRSASQRFSKGNHHLAKKVINTKTGEQFETITIASENINIKFNSLYAMLTGACKNKTSMKIV